jgi:uncharacterized protein YcfL
MKAIKTISLTLLAIILVVCQGCSSDQEIQTVSTKTLSIFNGGKAFEYWIDKTGYSSGGETITAVVEKGTQITVCGVVVVRQGSVILPNIQIYQDGSRVTLVKITSSFYWYQVK